MRIPGLTFAQRQLRARPLAAFSVAFLLGLLTGRQLRLPAVCCWAAFAALSGGCVALRRRRRLFALLLVLLGLAAGMLRMTLALDAIPSVEPRDAVEMVGRVVSEPFTNAQGRRVMKFQLEDCDGEPEGMRLRLYLRGDPEQMDAIECGHRLRLTGKIWKCDPVTNPYEFDFEEYLNRGGMSGYVTAAMEDVALLERRTDLRARIISARAAIGERIDALFPDSAGAVRALVLGDRTLLSDETRDALSKTGTAHLICISGLHVTVLVSFLAFALRLRLSRKRANVIAALLLIPYGALIGFSAPFARALMMFAVFAYAPVAGYPSDAPTRLCAAMLMALLVSPLSVTDAGFALSYSATAGVLLLAPVFEETFGIACARRRHPSPVRWKRMLKTLALFLPELFCASLAAQLASLPAVIRYFGSQSLVALPFNLLCVPLCMAGYIGAVAVLMLSALSVPAAVLVARAPDALFSAVFAIARWSLALPETGVRIGRYPMGLTIAHWMIILAMSNLSRIRRWIRRLMPLALAAIAAISTLIVFAHSWEFSVTFLDAGQGDSAVVCSRGRTYAIDVGDVYTPAGDYLAATCLHLNGIFLSHPHQDHAGGLLSVLRASRPDAIYIPVGWYDQRDISEAVLEGMALAEERGIPIIELSAWDAIELSDTAMLTVLSPPAGQAVDSANALSLLMLITCEGQRAMFTGDLPRDAEPQTVPGTDILKVAHHGSSSATSPRFSKQSSPEIAVISVGENQHGHPSGEVLQTLKDAGARVLLTRDCGAIQLRRRGGKWRIKTYLEVIDELE